MLVGEWTTSKHIEEGSDGELQSLTNIAENDLYLYGAIFASTNGVLNTPVHSNDIAIEPATVEGNYPRYIYCDYSCTTLPAGQGLPSNRPVTFPEHWVVEVNSKVYDPSYGVSCSTEAAYEDKMIAGFQAREGIFFARTNEIGYVEIRFER